MQDDAVRRDAGLARVAELAGDRLADREIDIRVIEHDEWAVATQLHRRIDNARGGLSHQLRANTRRTGEADLAEAVIVHDPRRHVTGLARVDEIHDAGGEARVDEHLHEERLRQRGVARRLHDDGAAGAECRARLACRHEEREVPRGDEVGGADGPVTDDDAVAAVRSLSVGAVEVRDLLGEPEEERC